MAITPTPLFQTQVATAVAIELYEPTDSTRLEQIIFVNTDASARDITLYHDIDGRIYDNHSVVLNAVSVDAGERLVFDDELLLNSSGTLGVKASVADAFTITGYGWASLVSSSSSSGSGGGGGVA